MGAYSKLHMRVGSIYMNGKGDLVKITHTTRDGEDKFILAYSDEEDRYYSRHGILINFHLIPDGDQLCLKEEFTS